MCCFKQMDNYNETTRRTALDELHMQLTPVQFSHLLCVISGTLPSSALTNIDIQNDLAYTSTAAVKDESSTTASSIQTADVPIRLVIDTNSSKHKPHKTTKPYNKLFYGNISKSKTVRNESLNKSSAQEEDSANENELVVATEKLTVGHAPKTTKQVLDINQLKGVNWKTSFDSTISSRCCRQLSNDSMLAISGGSMVDAVMKNLNYAESKYMEIISEKEKNLSLTLFGTSQNENLEIPKHVSCSQLRICKRKLGKYDLRHMKPSNLSRSSSTETVKAESLPEVDNPYEPIAGKIANEPVNLFPILRQPKLSSTPQESKRWTGILNSRRSEQDLDRLLLKSEDYKDVSKFFSRRPDRMKITRKSVETNGKRKVVNLNRRVTNPLYKAYDPAGYSKSEDEMALECIQMICEDFNNWLKTLQDVKNESKDKTSQESQDEVVPNIEIGPEFLLKILRRDLELPESYYKH